MRHEGPLLIFDDESFLLWSIQANQMKNVNNYQNDAEEVCLSKRHFETSAQCEYDHLTVWDQAKDTGHKIKHSKQTHWTQIETEQKNKEPHTGHMY